MSNVIRMFGESDAAYEGRTGGVRERKVIRTDWLVIECSATGEDGDTWIGLHQSDVPEWVKDPEVVAKLRDGVKVCWAPSEGTMWYRGVRVPDQEG